MKVYSMPEAFLKDQSVPARWRVLGIVNGFAINGLDCYASNAWFMEQLGCTSEQTISNAVEELEKLGEITCERTRRSRVMRRTFRDPNDLGSQPQPVRVSDPNQLGTNSPRNSPNRMHSVAEAPEFTIEEENPRPKRVSYAKYPHAKEVFELWGKYPQDWMNPREPKHRIAAENLYEERGIEATQEALQFIKDFGHIDFFPSITSPYDLDSKWAKLEAKSKELAKKL